MLQYQTIMLDEDDNKMEFINFLVKALPSLAAIVPFEMFSELVDEVLEEMKDILVARPDVLEKVNG